VNGTAGPSDLSPAFAEVLGIVAAARRRVQTGGSVDLADLPAKVEKSCGWLLGLPREEGRLYGELLQTLKRDLDALAEAVQQRRAELSRQLAPDGAE
jgi:hypothetical protein